MLVGLHWQLHGIIPRTRDGTLVLRPPKSLRSIALFAFVGAWIFLLGGIAATFDLLLNTSTSRVKITTLALLLVGLALSTFLIHRLRRVFFTSDRWGLSWNSPLWPSANKVPWERIASISVQGRALVRKIVVTDIDGRTRSVWLSDPSIPMSLAALGAIVTDIEGARPADRGSAATPTAPA